jgi:hypothetical protein
MFNSNTNDWLLGVTAPERSYDEKLRMLCGYKRPVVEFMNGASLPPEGRVEFQAAIDARVASRQPRCVGTARALGASR